MAKAKELRQDIVDLLDEFYEDDADFILKIIDELLRETAVNFELSSYQFPDGYEDDVNERYDKWSTPNTGDKK